MGEAGSPLDSATRADMERHFGRDLSHVRTHTGALAHELAGSLGASALTQGRDIVFGHGRAPGSNALTAHEVAHVVQQTGGLAASATRPGLSAVSAPNLLQRDVAGSFAVPYGGFEVELTAVHGGPTTNPPNRYGMNASFRFIPARGAPNSNVIAFTQILQTLDLKGADVDVVSMAPMQAHRGALGSPGLRTQTDLAHGVQGGFATDVYHQAVPTATAPAMPVAPGTALSPLYWWQTPGFKRSDDPADIRSAKMVDGPGFVGPAAFVDFAFESVVRGEDTLIDYGAIDWGFGLRGASIVNERLHVVSGHSATFNEALERHRDFYVHEPVTFYFGFNSDVLIPSEEAKIDTFTGYLARNRDIHMDLEGFADIAGGKTAYNADLSGRRAAAVERALLARGIPQEDIFSPTPTVAHLGAGVLGRGASTAATTNAGTGDEGGKAAVGADQSREANRWANRRVILTFRRVTPAAP